MIGNTEKRIYGFQAKSRPVNKMLHNDYFVKHEQKNPY